MENRLAEYFIYFFFPVIRIDLYEIFVINDNKFPSRNYMHFAINAVILFESYQPVVVSGASMEGGVAADMVRKTKRRGRPKKNIVSGARSCNAEEVAGGSGARKKRGRPKRKIVPSPEKKSSPSVFGENFHLSADRFPLEEYVPPPHSWPAVDAPTAAAADAERESDVEMRDDFVDMYEDDSSCSPLSLVFSDDSDEYMPASYKKKKIANEDSNKRNSKWKLKTIRELKRKKVSLKKPSTGNRKRSGKIPKRDHHRAFSGTALSDEDVPYFYDSIEEDECVHAPSASYWAHFVQLDAVSALAAADFEENPLAYISEQADCVEMIRLDLDNAEPQDGDELKRAEEKKAELELAKSYLLNFGSFINVCDSLTQLWAPSDDTCLENGKSEELIEEDSFDEIICYSD